MMGYEVRLVQRGEVRDFIEQHHYSHNVNGLSSKYCFALFDSNGSMIGASMFGSFGSAGVWRKYGDSEGSVLELRRMVLIDDTKRNAESFFIGKMLKWLARNTSVLTVVSYADPNYGHDGVVYRASNFTFAGRTQPGKVVMWNGRKYHDRSLRSKHNGQLKPFAVKLRQALKDGEAYYVDQLPKNIYVYHLHDKTRSRKSD